MRQSNEEDNYMSQVQHDRDRQRIRNSELTETQQEWSDQYIQKDEILDFPEELEFDFIGNDSCDKEKLNYESIPLFTIYCANLSDKKTEVEVSLIQSLLSQMTVPSKDIVKVDPTNDYELTEYLKSSSNGQLILPLVFIRRRKLGGLEELVRILQTGELRKLIDEHHESDHFSEVEEHAPQLGVINRALEGVETVMSYFNPWSYLRRGAKSVQNELEFEVIHTNWYFRRLRRKLIFFGSNFSQNTSNAW